MGSAVTTSLAVVVPARDEQDLLPGCLASLRAAADELPDGADVVIVVAADSCTDGTVDVAADHARADPRVRVVAGPWGCAGAARRAGTALALELHGARDPSRIWLASTDADSAVPQGWLVSHLALADAGWDAVAGIVRIADDVDPLLHARFQAVYPVRHGHPHPYVHGANLGIRADAYAAIGGWPSATATGEDQQLWDAVTALGRRTLATTDLDVLTSARLTTRAPAGFGARLQELTA